MSCCKNKTNRLSPIEVLARINGWQNTPIMVANVASMKWSAYILEQATGEENEVSGYLDVAMTPISSYVYDVLQTDSKWEEDATGYNFHLEIPGAVFQERGQVYLIRVTFTMVTVGEDSFTGVFLINVE